LQRIFEFDGFRLDPNVPSLSRGAELINIPPKALEILSVLIANAGQVVRKDDLLSLVWPNTAVEEGNLAVHVISLRKALRQHGNGDSQIETVPKRGYRFTARVETGLKSGSAAAGGAPALFRLAEHYLNQNNPSGYRRAGATFQKIVEIDPLNARARAGLADSLLMRFFLEIFAARKDSDSA